MTEDYTQRCAGKRVIFSSSAEIRERGPFRVEPFASSNTKLLGWWLPKGRDMEKDEGSKGVGPIKTGWPQGLMTS